MLRNLKIMPTPRWFFGLALLLALGLAGCSGGVGGQDIDQPRLDTPAPRIETADAVGQTFVAHEDGLAAVELLLAVYPDPLPAGALTFRLVDDTGAEVARVETLLAGLRHNDPLRLDFAPQPHSAGRAYRFTFSGPPGNPATFWSSKADAYADGTLLVQGQAQPGDLNFKTYTQLGYGALLGGLVQGALGGLWLMLPLLGVFFVPGYALLLWLDRGRRPVSGDYRALSDPAGRLALSVGLSLAVWPLLFLVLSPLPVGLNAMVARAGVLVLALWLAWRVWGRRGRVAHVSEAAGIAAAPADSPAASFGGGFAPDNRLVMGGFLALLLVTSGLRALHARGLVVPPWVDSIQHAVAINLFVEGGRLPTTWGPDVVNAPFYYHFGFHAVTALFTWLSGLPTEEALLLVGQVMNVLVAVGAYLLTARLTGRRGAGLVAFAIVGTVTLMPSYYITWGRYTQLTGLALLPTAAVLTFDAIEARPPVGRRIILAGLTAGALVVTHYRVLSMFAALVLVYLLVDAVAAVWQRRWLAAQWVRALSVAGVAFVVTLPWWVRLAVILVPTGTLGGWLDAPATFNTPHWGLLALRYDRPLILLSALGAALSVLGAVLRVFGVRLPIWTRPKLAPTVLLAAALTVLMTNPTLLGGRNSWVLSNDALIIAAFLPVAILTGYALAALQEAVVYAAPGVAGRWLNLGGALALVVASLWMADGMLSVVNPVTILATRDDVTAAQWIRANTPANARFLVNARLWQESGYAAPDGGGWLPILADRAVTLPPISYTYASSKALLDHVTQVQATVAQAKTADDLLPTIKDEGVSYVYIGAKGGALKPEMFQNRPDFRQVYTNGPAWVFEVVRR